MNITCYYSERLQLTKKQCEAINKGIIIISECVRGIWEGVKEMARSIVEGFRKIMNDFKQEYRTFEKPEYFSKPTHFKSQVLDNKPKFIRIRNNC